MTDRREKALEILKQGAFIPAAPLVLDENRQFSERIQRRLIRYYLESGAGGIAAAVHTTQFAIRKPEYALFEPVLAAVADEINEYENEHNKAIVRIAGVCGETPQALSEAETAKKYGYDAVLLSPGGLAGYDEEHMLGRTRAVAGIMPIIGFYLQPAVGGRRLSYGYWEKIVEIPNVAAIKIAPFDRYMTLDAVRAAASSSRPRDIALYTGNDDCIIFDLISGYSFGGGKKSITGGLLGHWSCWTKRAVEIYEMTKRRENLPELLILANQITDANAAFFDAANGYKGCIAGIHEVLRRQGLIDGIWCLDPKETLSPGQSDEIDRVYKMYPHLNDDSFVKEFLRARE